MNNSTLPPPRHIGGAIAAIPGWQPVIDGDFRLAGGVQQHYPRYLVRVEAGELPGDHPAVGVADQHIRRPGTDHLEQGVQLPGLGGPGERAPSAQVSTWAAIFNDPQITALLEQARGTANLDQRAALVAQAEKLTAQQLPWIPGVQPMSVLLLGEALSGAPHTTGPLVRWRVGCW